MGNKPRYIPPKIFYEVALETVEPFYCKRHNHWTYEVIDVYHDEPKKGCEGLIGYVQKDELFSITIYKEVIGDIDRREYIHLNKDGTFTDKLPKYILKGVQPLVDRAMKDKRFVTDE